MSKKFVFLLFILILVSIVHSDSSIDYVSYGYLFNNVCMQYGNCSLNNLEILGNITNVSSYDVTGPVNAYSYSLNGTDLFDTFVPYTGAKSNVNLGSKSLTANELTGGDVVINDHTITTSDSGDLYIDQILTRFTLDDGITIGVNNNFGFSVDTYDAFIKQLTADKDFYLQYNDGGVNKTALYVDGSEGEIAIGGSSPISGRDVTINGDLDTGENTYYGDSIHITPEAPQNIPAFLMGEWNPSIPFGFNYPGTLQIISNNSIYFSAYHPPSGLQFLFGNSIENLSFFGSYTDHPTEIRTGNQERIHLRDSSGDNEILLGGNAKYLPDTDFLTLYKSNNGGYGPNIKFINPNTGDNSGSKLEWRISTSTVARAKLDVYRTAGYLTHMDFYTGSMGLTMSMDDENQVGIGTINASYPLEVQGNDNGISIYASHNISAAGFIDRTPSYDGNAIESIKKVKSKDKEIDHDSLDDFVKTKYIQPIYEDRLEYYDDIDEKTNITTKKSRIIKVKVGEEILEGRNIGNQVSVNVKALQEVIDKIEYLEFELCKKDKTYGWCLK